MDVTHLRTFLTTVQAGSVSVAARELVYSPSGVSRHLRALEAELGLTLFVRVAGRLVPSTQAAEIIPLAESVVALVDAISATLDRQRTTGHGQSRLRANAGVGRVSPRAGTDPPLE